MEFTDIYDERTLRHMKRVAESLSERERRAYVASEAYKVGVRAASRFFGMSTGTIKRGKDDLESPENLPEPGRQRHPGAGRKGVCFEQEGLEEAFDALIKTHLAGDPMNEGVVWTDLQPSNIVRELAREGFSICENTGRALLKKKRFASASPSKRR